MKVSGISIFNPDKAVSESHSADSPDSVIFFSRSQTLFGNEEKKVPPLGQRRLPTELILRQAQDDRALHPNFVNPVKNSVNSVKISRSARPHPDALDGLEELAFRLNRRRDDDLGLLEFLDRGRADVAHAGHDLSLIHI